MKGKKLFVILAILALVALPAVALADGIITIVAGSPGPYDLVTSDVNFGSHEFSWLPRQLNDIDAATPWVFTDPTLAEVPWRVNLTSQTFADGASGIPLSTGVMQIEIINISCIAGSCGGPQPVGGTGDVLTNVPKNIFYSTAAAPDGGVWEFTPRFDLLVPANLAISTYTAIWTFDASASP